MNTVISEVASIKDTDASVKLPVAADHSNSAARVAELQAEEVERGQRWRGACTYEGLRKGSLLLPNDH